MKPWRRQTVTTYRYFLIGVAGLVLLLAPAGCAPVKEPQGHRPEPSQEIRQQQTREAMERLTAEWAYQQGVRALSQENLPEAIHYFQLTIERDIMHLRAYLSLGDVYCMQNKYLLAETYYNKILKYDPESIPAYTALGAMHRKMGNYREALSFYQKVLEIDPSNYSAAQQVEQVTQEFFTFHYEQGLKYTEAGDLEHAAIEWQKAQALYPDRIEFTVEIGDLLSQMKDYMLADGYFQQALSQDPTYVPALLGAGDIQLALKHYQEAITYFARALDLQPDNQRALNRLQHARSEKIRTSLPAQYATIAEAEQVTRGDLAALLMVDLMLESRLQPQSRLAIISDITTHWAKPYIIKIVQLGIMNIFPDRSFLPNEPIRKGEFAFILDSLARQLSFPLPDASMGTFSDVSQENMYHGAILRVYSAGLIHAASETTFGVNDLLSGEDVFAILAKMKQYLG